MRTSIELQDIHIANASQRTITNLGGKGSGKTTLLKMMLADRDTTLVFDPLGVINDKVIDAYRIVLYKGFDDKKIRDIARVVNELLKKKKNVVLSFNNMIQEEEVAITDLLLPMISFKDGYIFFDEIHEFVPNFGGSIEVERFIRHCRNLNIGVFMTSQRPASVKKNVLALTDYLIIFRMTWTHDLKAVKDLLSDVVEKDELKKMMSELPRLDFMNGYIVDYRLAEAHQ